MLLGYLERQRAIFAWKCAGLDEVGLRTTVGVSSNISSFLTSLSAHGCQSGSSRIKPKLMSPPSR